MLVATLANPYGYKLHVHIYRYLSDRFLMDHIDEFLSPNFHGLPQKCFAVLVLLSIVGVTVGRTRVRTSQVLVLCFAVYTGLYASRNIPVSSMLLALIIAPILSAATGECVRDSAMVWRGLARWHDFMAQHEGDRIAPARSRLGASWSFCWVCGYAFTRDDWVREQ